MLSRFEPVMNGAAIRSFLQAVIILGPLFGVQLGWTPANIETIVGASTLLGGGAIAVAEAFRTRQKVTPVAKLEEDA